MPMLTLRQLVKKLRHTVIREFIHACHAGVLDDDRVGFAIHRAIMRLSAAGYTGVLLPALRRPARCEPLRRGPPRRREATPPVVVAPPPSAPVMGVPASNPFPPGYCPVHGYEPCILRDVGVLDSTITAALRLNASNAPTTPPTPTPAEEERPRWRPPTPAPLGFGRRPTMAARTGCPPFYTDALDDADADAVVTDDVIVPPPPSALPMPPPSMLAPRRHAGEAAARCLGLRLVQDEDSTTGALPNGFGTGGWLSSDEERADSIS
ncbi:hypothetical protein U9M48_012358 [Paspalum notatum var. saurae]|uniref:Uncharacterized protein n=1 Tax=Paspalum notatum var. saurae TaxID=547442 RepID=A0AAQ3WIH4_PASNO